MAGEKAAPGSSQRRSPRRDKGSWSKGETGTEDEADPCQTPRARPLGGADHDVVLIGSRCLSQRGVLKTKVPQVSSLKEDGRRIKVRDAAKQTLAGGRAAGKAEEGI